MRTFSLLVRDLHVLLEILFLVSKIFCFRLDHRSEHTINERGDTGNLQIKILILIIAQYKSIN